MAISLPKAVALSVLGAAVELVGYEFGIGPFSAVGAVVDGVFVAGVATFGIWLAISVMAIEGLGRTRIPFRKLALVVGVPGVVVSIGIAVLLDEDNGMSLFWAAILFQVVTSATGLFQVSRRGRATPPVPPREYPRTTRLGLSSP